MRAEPLEDEELREELDMHSIISSCLVEEPLFTAEQVSSQTHTPEEHLRKQAGPSELHQRLKELLVLHHCR